MNKTPGVKESPGYAFIFGFGLSLLLTCAIFAAIGFNIVEGTMAVIAIGITALAQVAVQLIFFLHLGRESSPRWNGKMFFFTALMITILVAGTLWIMQNLDYNMSSKDSADYLLKDEGLQP